MSIITEKKENFNSFQLSFNLYGADGTEFLDFKLPFPNTIQHLNGFVRVMWLINGYTGTNKSLEYLNDIIARFLISFKEYKPQRLPYKLNNIQNDITHELKEFQGLESIKRRSYDISRAEMSSLSRDMIFYAIKFYAEQLIIDYGFCQYDRLEDFALTNFIDKKDSSTLKAKCRNIFYWYEERDFKIQQYKKYDTKEDWYKESKMTRQAHMIKVNQEKVETNQRIVQNAITGLYAEEYKKPNGQWNISKLSKDLGLSRPTIMKYL